MRNQLVRSLACGFLLAAVAAMFPFAAASETLPENVVRLRVVANSNSPEDQAVKLAVRDAVLREAARWYQGASSKEEASAALCVHLGSIQAAAEDALEECGRGETAAAQVTDVFFPTREYDGFTLPAGEYRTLQITIGKGEGKNWWCVAFPALCLPAAEAGDGDPLSALPDGQRQVVENPGGYKVKFKAVELYERLRQRLKGK